MDCSFCFLLNEFWNISNLGIKCLIYTNRAINVIMIMVVTIIIVIIIIMIIIISLIMLRPRNSNKVKIFWHIFSPELGHSNNVFCIIYYNNRPYPNTEVEFNRYLVPSLKTEYADSGWPLIRWCSLLGQVNKMLNYHSCHKGHHIPNYLHISKISKSSRYLYSEACPLQ